MAIVVIPHASVLTVRVFGETIHVWCPECSAAVMAPLASDTVPTGDMAHDENCPIRARIKRAEQLYEAAGLARWWKT